MKIRVKSAGRVTAWVTIALLGLLVACAGGQRREARIKMMQEATLGDAAQDFWEGVRWERWDAAGVHVADKLAWITVTDALLDAQGTFHISDFTMVSVEATVDPDGGPSKGEVITRYELTTLPTQKLERRTWVQSWTRIGGQWKLVVEGDEAALFLAEGAER